MSNSNIFDQRRGQADSHLVKRVTLAGSPAMNGDPYSVLHWRIFLYVDDEHSVVLDMTPGGIDGSTGLLLVSFVSREMSDSTAAAVDFPVILDFTVNSILALIMEHGRERYMFTASGTGCRFWCSVVLRDMEKANMVPPGSSHIFDQKIEQLSQSNPTRFPLPTLRGTFYVGSPCQPNVVNPNVATPSNPPTPGPSPITHDHGSPSKVNEAALAELNQLHGLSASILLVGATGLQSCNQVTSNDGSTVQPNGVALQLVVLVALFLFMLWVIETLTLGIQNRTSVNVLDVGKVLYVNGSWM
ncbi:hypothetical protein FRC06_005207 [Ceratobasidium sp. 370]|nr:hypothetical protein FRC06_005207 [Ceratobasidium sp. 370]